VQYLLQHILGAEIQKAFTQTGAIKETYLAILVRFSLYVMLGPAIAQVAIARLPLCGSGFGPRPVGM
jgi:hypothetical protein